MKHISLFFFICLLFRTTNGQAQAPVTYQAEAGQLVAANVGTGAAGYTGSGFVQYLTTAGASSVTFTVNALAAGPFGLKVRYAAALATERTMSVYVNGVDVTQARFPATLA
ncbi:CBM35 domain-containing protein [Hymenobacter sp. IS2118]|uniref:CBM35 domain-containing protein n=1 Tax=Hymenobacter sp. IS2118 TaxID=1505605 RepID=UPI00054D0C6D|nr:CBM35 domain-containing protein [Hymenobacter sp. IS2118]